ncbi:MAG: TIGR00268 family protein [Pirellulaceae bacterium]|nr:TIGR00268 family protein [Pirellulaceae bacterium]
MTADTNTTERLASALIDKIRSFRRVVVAFSGGVDSSVVAAAAARAELPFCIAVTARSPSVPAWQIDIARQVAAEIGIAHQFVATGEGKREEYVRNDTQRCFYCKETLYETLATVAAADQVPINHDAVNHDAAKDVALNHDFASHDAVILSGTNRDDLGDHRPGIRAGRLARVQTPLADLGLTKQQVRELAQYFGLRNHALPASPCLASRIAYGVNVTPERLRMVEAAEDWLREQGFSDCRVRMHHDQLARVEVPLDEMSRLVGTELSHRMNDYFIELGFQFVTLDIEGLRSGSLNRVLVSIDTPDAQRVVAK